MPKNSFLGQRNVNPDVTDASSYSFAPGDSFAMVTRVPLGEETSLFLPPTPAAGEWYGLFNPDGSCNSTSPINVIVGAPGQTIAGKENAIFFLSFVWAEFIFDDESSSWAMRSGTANDTTAVLENTAQNIAQSNAPHVPAGGPIVGTLTFVPQFSGKVKIEVFVGFTPVLPATTTTPVVTTRIGAGPETVVIQGPSYAGTTPDSFAAIAEVDIGTGIPTTFTFRTTVGDNAISLGTGVGNATAAAMILSELP